MWRGQDCLGRGWGCFLLRSKLERGVLLLLLKGVGEEMCMEYFGGFVIGLGKASSMNNGCLGGFFFSRI